MSSVNLWHDQPNASSDEYIRADTVADMVAEARNAALEEAGRIADDYIDCFQKYVDANEARIDAEAKLAQAVGVLEPLITFALDNMYEADIPPREAVEKDIVAARAFLAMVQPEGGTDAKPPIPWRDGFTSA